MLAPKLRFPRNLWLILLGVPWTQSALCQCNGNNFLQTCDLEGSHDVAYDPPGAAKFIDFQLLSRWQIFVWSGAVDYRVTVSPLAGAGYTLSSGTDQAEFSLAFQPNNGTAVTLTPGIPTGSFEGSTNLIGATFYFSLINPEALSGNNYSGEFEFFMEQQNNCAFGCQSLSVNFTINMTVPTRIIVKNFNDMLLDTATITPGNPIEGYEDICVGGIGFANYMVNLASTNGFTGGGSGHFPFQLNGVGENLPYASEFIDDTSGTSGFSPGANGDINQPFPRAGNENCIADNARVIVSIAAADWGSANETSYTDTLRVTVTAE